MRYELQLTKQDVNNLAIIRDNTTQHTKAAAIRAALHFYAKAIQGERLPDPLIAKNPTPNDIQFPFSTEVSQRPGEES